MKKWLHHYQRIDCIKFYKNTQKKTSTTCFAQVDISKTNLQFSHHRLHFMTFCPILIPVFPCRNLYNTSPIAHGGIKVKSSFFVRFYVIKWHFSLTSVWPSCCSCNGINLWDYPKYKWLCTKVLNDPQLNPSRLACSISY